MLFALIGALVVSGGAVLWLASRREAPPKQAQMSPRAKVGGRFSAVEIRPRVGACAAALQLRGRRFLAKNAPALPLRECSAGHCSCRFSKLPDRRTEGRRLEHEGLSAVLFLTMDRRSKRDRRRAAHRRA